MAESIYGHWETTLTRIMEKIVGYFESYNKQCKESLGEPAYEHLNFRIKSEKSMRDKCSEEVCRKPRNQHFVRFKMRLGFA